MFKISSLNEIARNNHGLLQGTGVYAPSTKPESEQKPLLHGGNIWHGSGEKNRRTKASACEPSASPL